MSRLFFGNGLTPHGFCLLWQPGLIWLHAVSDLLTGFAYFSIPLALLTLVRKRQDLAFGGVFWLFAAFIIACGLTHFMSVLTLWVPAYQLEGDIKALTALLSVLTACYLWPLLPKIMALPSLSEREATIARLRETEGRLVEANRWLLLGEKIGHIGHWRLGLPGRLLSWSDEMHEIYARPKADFVPSLDGVLACHPEADQHVIREGIERAIANQEGFEQAISVRRPNGEIRHLLSRGHVQFGPDNKPSAVFGVIVDKTDERMREAEREARERALAEALAAAQESQARYQMLAESIADFVACVGPDLQCGYASPSCLQLTDYRPEEVVSAPIGMLIAECDQGRFDAALREWQAGCHQEDVQFRVRRKNGDLVWTEAKGRLMASGGVIVCMRDVSRRKEAEDRLLAANSSLEALAGTDPLTGLANRRRFDELLKAQLRLCGQERLPLSLVILDLDFFKSLNDSHGHLAGDAVLRAVAAVIAHHMRRISDVAARYGGEEFAIILPATGAADAVRIAEQLRLSVRNLVVRHDDRALDAVTASFGVATVGAPDACSATELVDRADGCLYQAKASGRDVVICADPQWRSAMTG